MRGPIWWLLLFVAACPLLGLCISPAVAPVPPPSPEDESAAAGVPAPVPDVEARALMAQAALFDNSSGVLRSWNYPSSVPCPDGLSGRSAWQGVTCSSGTVTAIELGGLGLGGQLSSDLSALAELAALNLGRNNLTGELPPGWIFPEIRSLDLSSNELTGELPEEWGYPGAFSSLEILAVQGNQLEGEIPGPYWDLDSFGPEGSVLVVRPGNDGLCGPVKSILQGNSTQLELMHMGLFGPNTAVMITNTLGSCILPCSEDEARSVSIETNLFDLAAALQLPLTDLMAVNPDVANLPGESVSIPCYREGYDPPGLYAGGDVAFGMFAGGNELALDGLEGATAAGQVVTSKPGHDTGVAYYGSSNVFTGVRTLPLYWFVDLGVPSEVVALIVLAGSNLANAATYIGNDTSAVNASDNIIVGSDLQLTVPNLFGALGVNNGIGYNGRYVIMANTLFEENGSPSASGFNLSKVEVYTAQGDAARNKALRLPDGAMTSFATDVDNETCIVVQTDPKTGVAWAQLDLGYEALITIVGALSGNLNSDWAASIFVTTTATQDFFGLPADNACGSGGLALANGSYTTLPCYIHGRYVSVVLPNQGQLHLCELAVYVGDELDINIDETKSKNTEIAIAVAVPIAAVILALLTILIAAYFIVRRNYHRRKPGVAPPKFWPWLRDVFVFLFDRLCCCGCCIKRRRSSPTTKNGAESSHQKKKRPSLVWWSSGTGGSSEQGKEEDHHSDDGSPESLSDTRPYNPFRVSGRSTGEDAASLGSEGKMESGQLGFAAANNNAALSHSQGGAGGTSTAHQNSSGSYDGMPSGQFSSVRGRPTASQHSLEIQSTDLTKVPQFATQTLNVVDMSDVELLRVIGEGSFGQVWLASYCETTVAVKVLVQKLAPGMSADAAAMLGAKGASSAGGLGEGRAPSGALSTMQEDLQREATIMAGLRHPNCCQYLGICLDPPSLLMEYCAQRSVDSVLTRARHDKRLATSLSWARLLSMAFDAAKGMLYLHTRNPPIIHRDLKSANLLLDSQWHVKIADFNLSRAMDTEQMMSTICVTNPRWLSPEILRGGQATMPSDIYAFGTLMWELLTWELPFANMNPYQIINLVQSSGPPGLDVPSPDQLHAGPFAEYDDYVALMRECWALDPESRPAMAAVTARLKSMLRRELATLRAAKEAKSSGSSSGTMPPTPTALPGTVTPSPFGSSSPAPPRNARMKATAASPFSPVVANGQAPQPRQQQVLLERQASAALEPAGSNEPLRI